MIITSNTNAIEIANNQHFEKVNKKQAYAELLQLISRNSDHAIEPNLKALFEYFNPHDLAKTTDVFKWIGLAQATRDVRYYLNCVHSDGKTLVATNGHRIHWHDNYEMNFGFYDNNKNKLANSDVWDFANWKNAIPNEFFPALNFKETIIPDAGDDTVEIDDGKNSVIINYKYWQEGWIIKNQQFKIMINENKVWMKSGHFNCVIMGLK